MSERHLCIFAWLGWLAIVILGATQVTNWSTDNYSDDIIFREMVEVAEGRHRFGIVGITHYPNGPGYVFLPLLKMGVRDPLLVRWVPYGFSILSCGLFMLALVRLALSIRARTLLLTIWLSLALLPGFVYWQGAIHEHSFAMSLTLATMAVLLLPHGQPHRVLLPTLGLLGFLAGWMGFDFLPVHCVTALVVAFIARKVLLGKSQFESIRSSFLQSGALTAGMLLAIATHLAQNALYFGSWSMAVNDLFGSAAARAGLDSTAQAMNPEYYSGLNTALTQFGSESERLAITWAMTKEFFLKWGSPLWSTYFALLFGATVVLLLGRESKTWRALLKQHLPELVLALLSSVAWIALMPKHSMAHFHFLPRHYIAGLMAFAIVLVLACESSRDTRRLSRHQS